MKLILPFSLCLFFLSCQQTDNGQARANKLTSFQGFPPGVDGCTCYFGSSEQDFMKEKFLFVSDMDSAAHISINGKMTKLKLLQTDAEPNAFREKDYKEIFTDGYYKLIIDVKHKGDNGDEVWQSEGNMKLLFKDNPVDSTYFIGECGC